MADLHRMDIGWKMGNLLLRRTKWKFFLIYKISFVGKKFPVIHYINKKKHIKVSYHLRGYFTREYLLILKDL